MTMGMIMIMTVTMVIIQPEMSKVGSCIRWWRKTPLEISHPSRALMARQKTFLLFCDGSAAKEQWFTALSWACNSGGPTRQVEDMYTAFCAALRENSKLRFPQVIL